MMNSIKMLLPQAEVYSKDLHNLSPLGFYDLVEKACLCEPTYKEMVKDGKSLYVIYTFGDGCQVVLDKGILFYKKEDVQAYTVQPSFKETDCVLLEIDHADLTCCEDENMLMALEDNGYYALYTNNPIDTLAEGVSIDELSSVNEVIRTLIDLTKSNIDSLEIEITSGGVV